MFNPFNPDKDSGSYVNLQKRILQRVRLAKINDRISEVLQGIYEDAVDAEKIVLSRAEKKRLQSQIFKLVLEDLIERLGK
jgi:hypothetical protein